MNEHELEQYIKKQAENIPTPPELSPEAVEKRLSGMPQKNKKPLRPRSGLVAAAACMLLLLVGGITAKQLLITSPPKKTVKPETIAENPAPEEIPQDISGYENAYEVLQEYREIQEQETDMVFEENASAADADRTRDTEKEAFSPDKQYKASSGSGSSDYSDTDVQVEGVMEGDIVKTDGRYIYTLQKESVGSSVTIYSVNGKEVAKVSDIDMENCNVNEMYVEKNRLIVISSLWEENNRRYEDKDIYYPSSGTTQISIYDIENPAYPEKLLSQKQSGNFKTSRISGGYLYTFSQYSVNTAKLEEDTPETYIPLINDTCIKSENVRCISNDASCRYMVMTSLPLDGTSGFSDSICALGGADVYYVSNENIYCTNRANSSGSFGRIFDESFTNISKYSYDNGSFRFVAKRKVRGIIKDSYYMHEYKGNLCYVYTRTHSNGKTSNGIVTLNAHLKKLGELDKLGKNERIYSSYYMDNIAYFVTYRETDPVFAVDLSDASNLKLLSELKIPGFSSYLHAFGDGLLLGIGQEESNEDNDWEMCAKLSIFSIQDNHDIQEICKKLLRSDSKRELFSSTIAADNHKAVFVDEERKLFGFGIQYDTYTQSKLDSRYEVYSYAGNKLQKILSQKNVFSYSDVRGIRIGEYFYVVEPEQGITVYSMPEAGQTKPMQKVN